MNQKIVEKAREQIREQMEGVAEQVKKVAEELKIPASDYLDNELKKSRKMKSPEQAIHYQSSLAVAIERLKSRVRQLPSLPDREKERVILSLDTFKLRVDELYEELRLRL